MNRSDMEIYIGRHKLSTIDGGVTRMLTAADQLCGQREQLDSRHWVIDTAWRTDCLAPLRDSVELPAARLIDTDHAPFA